MRFKSWNRKNKMLFLATLEAYLGSGLSLDRSIDICGESFSSKKRSDLSSVASLVKEGSFLSEALGGLGIMKAGHTKLMRHGELSGDLLGSIKTIRQMLAKEDSLISSVISSMTYPMVIGAFSMVMTVALMKGVMPQIIPLLKSLNMELPMLTRVFIYLSDNLIKIALYSSSIIIILSAVSVFLYKKAFWSRYLLHEAVHRVPLVGRTINYISISLFMRSLGGLISSGVDPVIAYSECSDQIVSLKMKKFFMSNSSRVNDGSGISSVFRDIDNVPAYCYPIVRSGEGSGSLGSSMVSVADMLDKDVEHMLKRASALLEPVMMFAVGGVVGSMALSIMMPIYDISKVLQQ